MRCRTLTAQSRRAIAILLLTASGIVRHARAAVSDTAEEAVLGFEAAFASRPCAVEMGHALSALWVACELVGREVRVLEDDRVARHYLARYREHLT